MSIFFFILLFHYSRWSESFINTPYCSYKLFFFFFLHYEQVVPLQLACLVVVSRAALLQVSLCLGIKEQAFTLVTPLPLQDLL